MGGGGYVGSSFEWFFLNIIYILLWFYIVSFENIYVCLFLL